jgi:hypothetical protein
MEKPQLVKSNSGARNFWQRKGELWARNGRVNLAYNCDFHGNCKVFRMPQSCDMGPTALLPLRRKAHRIFSPEKNPTASENVSKMIRVWKLHRRCRISWSVGVTAVCLAGHWRECRRIAVRECLTPKITARHSNKYLPNTTCFV